MSKKNALSHSLKNIWSVKTIGKNFLLKETFIGNKNENSKLEQHITLVVKHNMQLWELSIKKLF